VPGGPRRYLVAAQQQTAHRVGFAVGAFPAMAAHLHETDRIRKTLEPPWRQRNEVGVSQTSDRVTQIFGNQELPRRAGRARGWTLQEIATELGFANRSTARRAIENELARSCPAFAVGLGSLHLSALA
jgi:hypothetical protein